VQFDASRVQPGALCCDGETTVTERRHPSARRSEAPRQQVTRALHTADVAHRKLEAMGYDGSERLLSVASALVIVGAGSFITLQAGAQGF
jgi:hypothetical protein